MSKLCVAKKEIDVGAITIGFEVGVLTSMLTNSFGVHACLACGVVTALLSFLAVEYYGAKNIEHIMVNEDEMKLGKE